jgi:diguanylate cyclase (GGDEF)-like protein
MSIRTRTAIIVMIPMISLVLLFVSAGVWYMGTGFTRLEAEDASGRVVLVKSWLLSQAGYQERNAQSYGYWTDTWVFVKRHDPAYIRWNMTAAAFQSIDTDFMIMLDTDGGLVYARFIRYPSTQAEILRFLRSEPELTRLTRSMESRRATIASAAGPVALGLAPIERDTGLGPIRGTMVCGRFLDPSLQRSLAALTGLGTDGAVWWSPEQPSLPQDAREAVSELTAPADVVVRRGLDGRTLGYSTIEGHNEATVGVVQVVVDPKLADTRRLLLHATAIGLVVFIIVGSVTFLVALDVSVLRRLGRLIKGVRRVGRSETKTEARVPVEGKDEIAELAVSVNEMLEAIDQQQEALRALATVDPLTGIFNRRRFTEELDRELERSKRLGVTGALLSIDLDDFKDINDTYGHAAGDEVLVTVAGLLQAEMRSYSVVSRFGGDEFVILLPGADRESGLKVANRLLETLAATQVPVGSETVTVRMSIGVACYPDDGVTAAAVLRAADAAMYTSKRDGRGCASVAPGIAVRDAASPATL